MYRDRLTLVGIFDKEVFDGHAIAMVTGKQFELAVSQIVDHFA